MFAPLPSQFSFPEAEERILRFWEAHDVFARSLAQRHDAPRFVFYEGPPTANGLPHPGHCLTRAIKDLFPRYQTMCGRLVERKAGWDTHGLPVEVEVCKELGIHTKEEIEQYGVEKFVRKCIDSVFRYVKEWEQMTRRLGFWVNLEDAYVTFHQSYVESVWWGLKTLFERGLLYQGHKVVWWWAQGGTALSAGEVGEGYRTVQDPSVYVKFPLVSEPPASAGAVPRGLKPAARVALLVWTTTPWTLISNHFAAVGPDIDYALIHDKTTGEYLYIASALVQDVADKFKHDFEAVGVCKGGDLVGLRYVPPFDCYYGMMAGQTAPLKNDGGAQGGQSADHIAWRVIDADFVDIATGTGIVHIAPAFGEVDFDRLQQERQRFASFDAVPLINAVKPDGTFSDEAPAAYRGRWVKDCDKDIIRDLKERGVLLHQETIEHEYPFCPRAEDDALIQYARKSWFVRTSQFKDEFLANNAGITWLPEHIKEGRFGDFLRNNVDWALSRERYWGTPLPIWVCEQCGKMEALGSLAELKERPDATDGGLWAEKKAADPTLPDHLSVHKPYIDAWTYQAPCCQGARMRRVPEVIDCWWDAGSMPFAQWGFPHVENSLSTFVDRFPADFISEALDQTRGWFYGMLAISTLIFGPKGALREHTRESCNAFMKAIGALQAPTRAPAKAALVADWAAEQYAAISSQDPLLPVLKSFKGPLSELGLPDLNVIAAATNRLVGNNYKAVKYPHPYKACIVLGLMLGEDGLKMSKRKKNYREPSYIFDHYGADAMRWFLFSGQTPWTSVRFEEQNIRDAQREFLVRLYNVFSFFVIYANIDGFEAEAGQPDNEATRQGDAARRPHVPTSPPPHATGWRPPAERSELDRWIISELHRTTAFVREKLDGFENYPAAGRLNEFVDALSNWYVRRSRDRFWRPLSDRKDAGDEPRPHVPTSPRPHAEDQDKWDAYNTLYEVLVALSKLIAPFTPFFAEVMYQNLVVGDEQAAEPPTLHPPSSTLPSVHLCDYPVADAALIDESLAQEMDLVRDIVSLGRAARTTAKLKVRQPLALAEIILARREHNGWLEAHSDLIAEELNIKQVGFATEAEQYVTCQLKADFKAIGPKFGKLAPQIAAALGKLDPTDARATLSAGRTLTLNVGGTTVQLTSQEVQVRLEAKPGWSAAQGRAGVVVVKTELTPELVDEGLTRELIHHVQSLRKELQLAYEQRITLHLEAPAELQAVISRFADIIKRECLAEELAFGPPPAGETRDVKIEIYSARLAVIPR